MSQTYGSSPPSGFGTANPRDQVTRAMMDRQAALQKIATPPPVPPATQMPQFPQPAMPGSPMPGSQPAAAMPAQPALGPMGPVPGPVGAGVNLPGLVPQTSPAGGIAQTLGQQPRY